MSRPSWSEYFMKLAHMVSSRSTCDRKMVGAVLVREKRLIATGYNGSAPGMPHCDDVGHDMQTSYVLDPEGKEIKVENCARTIHAEINAVAQAARFGNTLEGTSLYVNTFPCWPCFKVLISAGVLAVYFDDEYRADARVKEASDKLGIKLVGPAEWRAGAPL